MSIIRPAVLSRQAGIDNHREAPVQQNKRMSSAFIAKYAGMNIDFSATFALQKLIIEAGRKQV
jgi:hypothetical protein